MSEPLPSSWIDDITPAHSTVTGQFISVRYDSADPDLTPDVQPLNGSVLLTPTTPAGRIDDTLAHIVPVSLRVSGGQIVDEEEEPGVRILATDEDIGVEDWAWTATFTLDSDLTLRPLTFKAPAGETVNLTSGIIPVTSAPYQIVGGEPGESAYQVAVRNGYVGTETEWLASLQGDSGASTWDEITGKPDIIVAEDLAPVTARLSAVESTVDRIKQANVSYGEGAPSGTAPVGWHYTDVTTGDIYRMEA